MEGLTLEVGASGDDTVVVVGGEIDMTTAGELDACLRAARADDTRDVVVDLSAVTFLDSMGLYVLVTNYRKLRDSGHTLRVVGERVTVRRTLQIAGLLELLRDDQLSPCDEGDTAAAEHGASAAASEG